MCLLNLLKGDFKMVVSGELSVSERKTVLT
jgi:hypothetical protein